MAAIPRVDALLKLMPQDRLQSSVMSTESTEERPTEPFLHWCASCGYEELLTSDAANEAGWDFPPRMGTWGVVSPRTCPKCPMRQTAWWAMAIEKRGFDDLTPQELKAVGRILEEVPPGRDQRNDSVQPSDLD